MKESAVINVNSDGVIWVKSEEGAIFGLVNQFKILDEDGLSISEDAFKVLEDNGFELQQDWDNETTWFATDCKGQVRFCDSDVELVEAD